MRIHWPTPLGQRLRSQGCRTARYKRTIPGTIWMESPVPMAIEWSTLTGNGLCGGGIPFRLQVDQLRLTAVMGKLEDSRLHVNEATLNSIRQ